MAEDQMLIFVKTVTIISLCDVFSDEGPGLSFTKSRYQLYMLTMFTVLQVYIIYTFIPCQKSVTVYYNETSLIQNLQEF
jgi:hypothetical protein